MSIVTEPLVAAPPPTATRPPTANRLALVLLLVTVACLPLLVPHTPGNTGPVDLPLSLAMVAAASFGALGTLRIFVPYLLPVGILVAAGALAAVLSGTGGGLLALGQDLFLLAWAATVASIARPPSTRQLVLKVWAGTATIWALVLTVAVTVHDNRLAGIAPGNGQRASLTLGDPNLAASYFVMSLFLLLAISWPGRRLLRWGCAAMLVYAIVLTGSNGGLLALAMGLGVGAVAAAARRGGALAAVAAACLVVLATATVMLTLPVSEASTRAAGLAPQLTDSLGREGQSTGDRSLLLSENLQLWSKTSLLGVGPGGTKRTLLREQAPYVKEAHNDLMGALVERGLVGGVGVLVLAVEVARRARRAARTDRTTFRRPEFLLAALLAVVLGSFFYEVLHFRHVWTLFGIVAAASLTASRQEIGD